MAFFERLKKGLEKTRKGISEKVDHLLASFGKIDEALFEELEDILIASDVGIDITLKIIGDIKARVKEKKITNPKEIKNLLREELITILRDDNSGLRLDTSPSVIVVVGVNGVGKTTTIGKIAANLKKEGKRVVLAAADTFRAAAIEQLEIWADRADAEIIKHTEGADPAAVVYDAIQATKARKADVLICDTAGRLHTKKNLMEELKKIIRIIERELPGTNRETLLVLDATTGQNAISQARVFSEATDVSGIVLTKLDGTAKGGIIVAVKSKLGIPVKFIGVGEKIEDLQQFNAQEFVEALFSET
ncbi:MAG: signal recognition particle-docking protein FtsY [Firmicutes bacterium]|nr:signal recognition particle-docking protein FtsY [Bacillota bacterium]